VEFLLIGHAREVQSGRRYLAIRTRDSSQFLNADVKR